MADAPQPAISAAMVARGRRVAEPRWSHDGRFLAWVDSFAGRADIVVAPADQSAAPRVVTADLPAKGVASYGGGVFDWAPDGSIVYAAATGDIVVVDRFGGPVRMLTGEGTASAPAVSTDGTRVAYIVETPETCDIAVVPLDGSAWPVKVSRGADYSFDPSWSPDGRRIVWVEWDFPNMPWDASRVVMATVDGIQPTEPVRLVAGGGAVSVSQPRFSPDGSQLAWVSDETGFANVWAGRWDGSKAEPLVKEPHEHSQPTWGPGQRSWAWSPDGRSIAACRNEAGLGRLVALPVGRGRAREVASGWHVALDWSPRGILAVRSAPDIPDEVAVVDPTNGAHRAYARGPVGGFEEAGLPEPEAVEWKARDRGIVHGLLFRPRHSALGAGAKPPLLVSIHGGPTGQSTATFNARTAFFVDRGWAVLAPNYRGSTGYGRDFQQALRSRWGILDVEDTVAGIRHAGDKGWCDPDRVAVIGGSAGGFTVLMICALHGDAIRAGVDLFGVTDLFRIGEVSHRFECRYEELLVGRLPEDADRFRAQSPITHADKISVPLIVFQGDRDVAVPKEQSDAMVASLRAKGIPVEYVVYEDEGHGWSKPDVIEDELLQTEAFLSTHVLKR